MEPTNDELIIDATLARALVALVRPLPFSSLANLTKEEQDAVIEFFREPLPEWAR